MKNRHSSILLGSEMLISATRHRLLPTILALGCLAFSPDARAQVCTDGCNTTKFNTYQGVNALEADSGTLSSAFGYQALGNFISGDYNTAVGSQALLGIRNNDEPASTGSGNTATGFQALFSNKDGGGNVADGWQAAYSNSSGQYNTAIGVSALRQNTTGNNDTAIGTNALYHTNGNNNVALGFAAAQNLTTGSNNIIIGANVLGASADANVTRIGNTTQKKTFIGGIYNKTVASGVGVIVNSSGQLGTVQSSARYKDDIKPMDKTSEAILNLKPVTFHYKEEFDPEKIPQFGLIAEEVEKIDPDLVVRHEDGKVMTVRYDAVNAMLLNEFLKEHQRGEIQQQKIAELTSKLVAQQKDAQARFAQQQTEIEELRAGLQKVSAQVQLTKSARKVTLSDSTNHHNERAHAVLRSMIISSEE